jgi:hypothetical protein
MIVLAIPVCLDSLNRWGTKACANRWHPIASIRGCLPRIANSSSSGGSAVISLDFSLTLVCPSTRCCEVDHTASSDFSAPLPTLRDFHKIKSPRSKLWIWYVWTAAKCWDHLKAGSPLSTAVWTGEYSDRSDMCIFRHYQ